MGADILTLGLASGLKGISGELSKVIPAAGESNAPATRTGESFVSPGNTPRAADVSAGHGGAGNVSGGRGNKAYQGGSGSVKSGINQIEPYSGIKQASQFLKEKGFLREQRVEILQSFDVRTIYMDIADADTYGFRFHDFGKNAYPKGRYLYETFSNLSTREGAAIKQSWNEMTGIKQWKISEGTIIIKGKEAPQIENGYKYQGGVEQWFISKMEYLQEP